jgi:hypothetical protein
MTKIKSSILGAAGLAILFLATSLTRSQGNVATAAFSMGTAAGGQSVPMVDAERLARVPYQSFSSNSGCVGLTGCTFIFAPAPSGYRLVVENISGWFQLSNTAAAPPVVLLKDASVNVELGFTAVVGQPFGNGVLAALNQPTRAYFDPADGNILASVTASFPATTSPQRITLTGYLENCSITRCPAIQR